MPAALPKAPKACPRVKPWSLLEVPSSTSCAKSRNRRFPNEIRASSRFHRFYRGEEGPEICYPANWHAIGRSKAPKSNSKNSRPAGKAVGNSAVRVSRLHLRRVAGGASQDLLEQTLPSQFPTHPGPQIYPLQTRDPSS